MKIILISIFSLFLILSTYAHPLDVSLVVIKIENYGFSATVYIHQYEIILLLQDHSISLDDITLQQLADIIIPYFNKRFQIYGEKKELEKLSVSIANKDINDILTRGLYLNFIVRIETTDFPITFKVRLFIEYFSTQINKIVILDKDGNLWAGSKEILLTAKYNEWSFSKDNPDFSSAADDLIDTDNDKLSNSFEKLLGLDPKHPDTDRDGFSDSEELAEGWDPFDPKPAQNQIKNPEPGSSLNSENTNKATGNSIHELQQDDDNLQNLLTQSDAEAKLEKPLALINDRGISNIGISDNPLFWYALRDMEYLFSNKEAGIARYIWLVLLIFVLGFIEAAGPGHGKAILLAYTIHTEKRFSHALAFCISFTVAHILFSVIFIYFISQLKQVTNFPYFDYLCRIFSGIILLVISLFIIKKARKDLKKTKKLKNNNITLISALLMGIITAGIRPCTLCLYIADFLIQKEKFVFIPISIFMIGLGLFVLLLAVFLSILLVRFIFFDIFPKFRKYSYLISGVSLLVVSLVFFIPWTFI